MVVVVVAVSRSGKGNENCVDEAIEAPVAGGGHRCVVGERCAFEVSREVATGRGQTLVDLPYPRTATAEAAAAAGATVLDGLEVLVAQGAASFELWTGRPAPLGAMRQAVGLT